MPLLAPVTSATVLSSRCANISSPLSPSRVVWTIRHVQRVQCRCPVRVRLLGSRLQRRAGSPGPPRQGRRRGLPENYRGGQNAFLFFGLRPCRDGPPAHVASPSIPPSL